MLYQTGEFYPEKDSHEIKDMNLIYNFVVVVVIE